MTFRITSVPAQALPKVLSAINSKRGQYRKPWKCESHKHTGSKSSSSAKASKNENEINKLAEMGQKLNLLVNLPNKVDAIEQHI